MPVDEVAHPRRLARNVHVVGAEAHAGVHHPVAIGGERSGGAEQHAGATDHGVDGPLVGAIGHQDVDARRRGAQ